MPIWLLPLFGTIASKIIGIVIDYFWDRIKKSESETVTVKVAKTGLEKKIYPIIEKEIEKRLKNGN